MLPTLQNNALCLISYKLKTTVFTRSVFIFCESSYFNLKFGLKKSESSPRNGSPCIMCVQYIMGCSVHQGVLNTSGDIMSASGVFSTSGEYHDACGI